MNDKDIALTAPSPQPFDSENSLYASDYEHDSCGVGFVAQIDGRPSHDIVADACSILARMEHRGACGCEAETGDGAGILTGVPSKLVKKIAKETGFGIDYPYIGVGNVFFSEDQEEREKCKNMFAQNANRFGQKLIAWREVPVDPEGAGIGKSAVRSQPVILQVFIGSGEGVSQEEFERKLYLIRKKTTQAVRDANMSDMFYVCSLSSRIIVYKGMLSTAQLPAFFPDLRDKDYESHLAMVHSRFSTNTLPIGDDLRSLMPVIEEGCSDSGEFDNAMEMLMMSGRELPEVVMMMIPEAWRNHTAMSENKRAFYEYHSCLQEPWDGPASISFTDGRFIGAVLDRNGLRPSRYYVLDDNRVVMASEVGVLDIDPAKVVKKGRLEPGKMFLVDFDNKRIIADQELKDNIANARPYGEWVGNQRITFDEFPESEVTQSLGTEDRIAQMRAFGYTNETLDFMLLPMIRVKKDPILSMGNDAALACLSDKPRLLYDYFSQLFAQVTNPPIDSIREEIVMSVECYVGPEGNLLESTESQCNRLLLHNPILDAEQMAAIHNLDHRGWKSRLIETAIDDGCALIVLSDRAISQTRVPLSALLATSAVHHYLIEKELRTRIGILVETGEAREVHHHCLLTGFGADGIHPYLGLEAIIDHHANNPDSDLTAKQCVEYYRKGVYKGMLKVLAKMGISTLASYKGARIFEARH